MRLKLILFTVIGALAFASCDVLNQTPSQSLPTDGIFTSETNVRGVLAGAYNSLQSAVPYNIRFTELAADNALHTGSFPSWANVDQHQLLASNAEARDTYINYYDVINTANNLIAFTADVEDVSFSEQEKNEIIAQAKAIRAMSYHTLVRWFGGVPLVLEPPAAIDESVNVPRSTVQQVYDQIIKDLQDAETVLGANGTSGATTVSGYAVKALLARVYLYDGQYGLAETKASEVIDSGEYALGDYSANFGVLEADGQGSDESIFELSFTTEDANSLSFFARPNGNGGRYEYGPEANYISLYEANDVRFESNLRVYSGAYRLGKYFRLNGNDNIIIVRLAEMYLIRAEAIAQQDYETNPARALEAQDDINVIRNRAGLGDVDPLTVTTLEEFMDEVLLQRRIELDQEGHRWHDLVRTGRAVTTLGIDQNDTLWPIPQREIDSNSGINPEDQNPGY